MAWWLLHRARAKANAQMGNCLKASTPVPAVWFFHRLSKKVAAAITKVLIVWWVLHLAKVLNCLVVAPSGAGTGERPDGNGSCCLPEGLEGGKVRVDCSRGGGLSIGPQQLSFAECCGGPRRAGP